MTCLARHLGVLIVCSVLTACGGGSSSSAPASEPITTTPPPDTGGGPVEPADNRAPVADDSTVQLTEWAVYEGVLPGSDPDGDAVRFEIVESFVPFSITNAATGAYEYDPSSAKESGEVLYRIVDEWGRADAARITFLHNTKLALAAGECPRATINFDEPIARVWTHPDDSVLFVGFGTDSVINVQRYEYYVLGLEILGPALRMQGAVLGNTNQLVVSPDDPAVIYAVTFERDLYISRDKGLSFTLLASAEPPDSIADIAVTSGESETLWVVTEQGIFRSNTDVVEFTLVRAFDDEIPNDYHSIAVHPEHPERLLVSGQDTSLLTEDGGDTWSVLPSGPTFRLVVDPHNPDRIYGNGGDSVYLSNDFGATWQLTGFNGFGNDILVADPFRRGRLYIAPWDAFAGLWASENMGDRFDRVDEFTEQVRGMAFTSSGATYVSQGQSLHCLSHFDRQLLAVNNSLTLDLAVEDGQGQSVAERQLLEPVVMRLNIENFAGATLGDVVVEAWIEGPGGRSLAFRQTDVVIGVEGLELVVDLPSPPYVGRYKVVASVDPPADAPVGAAGWFVALTDPPEPVPTVEFAVLSMNTLWLNLAHPWFPIVTEVGEQRRLVLDVDNDGPDTARNVSVRIATGSLLTVDSVGPVLQGQVLDCSADTLAVTCALGDIGAGSEVSLELFVTPLAELTAVPVSLSSDTPSHGVESGGIDLVAELSAPTEIAAGASIGYSITVTNTGDARAESGRIEGAIGPWPTITGAHGVSFSNPACTLGSIFPDEEIPLTYLCSFYFMDPGEQFIVDIELDPAAGKVVHVVDAIGFPEFLANPSFELYRGNNLRGLITTPLE